MSAENDYVFRFNVCDRLWFQQNMKVPAVAMTAYPVDNFPSEI